MSEFVDCTASSCLSRFRAGGRSVSTRLLVLNDPPILRVSSGGKICGFGSFAGKTRKKNKEIVEVCHANALTAQ